MKSTPSKANSRKKADTRDVGALRKELMREQQATIKHIENNITYQTQAVQDIDSSIFNLETALTQAQRCTETYNRFLASLEAIRLEVNSIETLNNAEMEGDEDSREIHDDILSRMQAFIANARPSLEAVCPVLTSECRKLQSKIKKIKPQIDNLNRLRIIATDSLKHFSDTKGTLDAQFVALKDTIRICYEAPDEIWSEIFLHCVDEEVAEYLCEDRGEYLRPTALYLSHVCQQWREVAKSTSALWSFRPVYLDQSWPAEQKHLSPYFANSSRFTPTLVGSGLNEFALYQDLVDAGLPMPSPYNMTFFYGNREGYVPPYLPDQPFNKPSTLTIYLNEYDDRFQDLWSEEYFSDIERLRIVIYNELYEFEPPPMEDLGNLKYLSLELTFFGTHNLRHLVAPTLEELHLLGEFTEIEVEEIPELPNLRVLGIVPRFVECFQEGTYPNLCKLVLYPPNSDWLRNGSVGACVGGLVEFCLNIREFKVQGWKDRSKSALALVEEIVLPLRDLKNLEFEETYVEGDRLISLLSRLPEERPKLKVTLDRCEGITRLECERLSEWVSKLVVYV